MSGIPLLSISLNKPEPLRLLCLGAHCDDIEIGCGATILKLATFRRRLQVHWIVFSSGERRKREGFQSAEAFLKDVSDSRIVIHNFRDGFFPYAGSEIKENFEEIKKIVSPDLILTHYRNDLHQDHRFISELTWNTFRNHLILEYEIPKYDGDFGAPNVFVPIDEFLCRRKIDTIIEAFGSQREKHWFSRDLFSAILRLRGMESNSPSGYAEAFYCRKAIFGMEV